MLPLSPFFYFKIGVAGVAIIAAIWFYFWISNAFEERDKLRISDATKSVQIKQYQDAEVQNAKIRDDINAAISKIRVTSNTYVKAVDGQKPPVVPDGTVMQLVPGGMLPDVPSLSAFTNSTTNSTRTITETH
jgi:hypothetical protein